jgi:hypothetical protein
MRFLIAFVMAVLFCVPEAKAYEPLDFAFGENGSWVVLYKASGNNRVIKYGNLLSGLSDKFKEIEPEGRTLTGVGLDGKAGWIMLTEDRRRAYYNINNAFKAAGERVKSYVDAGWVVKDVALTPDGGYVLIYGQSNYKTNGWTAGGNIPEGLTKVLNELGKTNGSPTGIGITPSGGWAIVYTHKNCGKWHMRSGGGVPKAAAKFINEKF